MIQKPRILDDTTLEAIVERLWSDELNTLRADMAIAEAQRDDTFQKTLKAVVEWLNTRLKATIIEGIEGHCWMLSDKDCKELEKVAEEGA